MKTIVTIYLLVTSGFVFSQNQEIGNLMKRKLQLEKEKKNIEDSIKNIDNKINYLNHKEKSNVNKKEFVYAKLTQRGNIKKKPESESSILVFVEKGDSVKITDYNNGFWLVEKDSIIGYMFDMYFTENEYLINLKKKFEEKNQRKIKEKELARKKRIISKYGNENGKKILDVKIWIGMTEEMLYESWGKPSEVNRTVTKYGEYKQCIYYSTYVYIENGVVTSWQDKSN